MSFSEISTARNTANTYHERRLSRLPTCSTIRTLTVFWMEQVRTLFRALTCFSDKYDKLLLRILTQTTRPLTCSSMHTLTAYCLDQVRASLRSFTEEFDKHASCPNLTTLSPPIFPKEVFVSFFLCCPT